MCQDELCFAKKVKLPWFLVENEALIDNWVPKMTGNKNLGWGYKSVSNLIQRRPRQAEIARI